MLFRILNLHHVEMNATGHENDQNTHALFAWFQGKDRNE